MQVHDTTESSSALSACRVGRMVRWSPGAAVRAGVGAGVLDAALQDEQGGFARTLVFVEGAAAIAGRFGGGELLTPGGGE